MARKDDGVIGQREELPVDRFLQLLETAIREICAANATGEEYIAAEYLPRLNLPTDKYDMPARMPRRFKYVEFDSSRLETIALVQQPIRRRTGEVETERSRKVECGIGQLLGVSRTYHDRAIGPAYPQSSVANDVVAMPMSANDSSGSQRAGVQILEDRIRLETRVEHNAVVPAWEMRNIGILVKRR